MNSRMRVIEVKCRRALSRSNLPEMDYSVNPYHGCLHGCLYCFAMDFTPEHDAVEEWGYKVYARIDIAERLRHEIAGIRRGTVGISTITDPYQSIEGRYKLTRQCLNILLESGFYVTIQTKSPLVLRDMDILRKYAGSADVGITVTTVRASTAAILEPGSPSPQARLSAVRRLSQAGIRTWVYIGPIIRGLNDSAEEMESIVRECSETKSRLIFDRYSNYRHSDILIGNAISSGRINGDIRSSKEWWDGIVDTMYIFGKEYGVSTVTQEEDWMIEKKLRMRTLERF